MSKTRNAPNSSSKELNTLLVKTNDLFQQTKFDKKQKDFMNAAFLLIKSLTVKVTELIDQNEKLINDNKAMAVAGLAKTELTAVVWPSDDTIKADFDGIYDSNKLLVKWRSCCDP